MTLAHSGATELSQLMEGITAVALIRELVRRVFQALLEGEVSAAISAQLHELRPYETGTHRNDYSELLLTAQVLEETFLDGGCTKPVSPMSTRSPPTATGAWVAGVNYVGGRSQGLVVTNKLIMIRCATGGIWAIVQSRIAVHRAATSTYWKK
jgi:hypothetical protein